ncbi:MAG: alpha/beta hydrolase [Halomonadaceae bacterium]|nr:MAG: alpha/beta hydrolase [Halomonadaceae bacterium]
MQYRHLRLSPQLNLAITEAGKDAKGIPVVLLHGWTGRRHDWNPSLLRLQQAHPLMSIDLPGHGDSADQPPPAWTLHSLANTLVAALKIWHQGPVILVGHSMGGAVALEAARALPQVQGIVLIDTFILPYGDIHEAGAKTIEQPFYENFPKALSEMVDAFMAPMAPSMQKAAMQRNMCSSNPFLMLPLWSDLLRWSPDDAFDELGIPIHAINGDMIPSAAYSRCADYVTEWRMPGAGHFPHVEMPEAFQDLLAKVVATIKVPSAKGH